MTQLKELKAIMKINKILISGLAVLTLSACNDFLDVAPATSSAGVETAFGTEANVQTALNGVYAKILSDNPFGNNLYNAFQLNSDVDFATNTNESAAGNQPRRFDLRSDASNVESLWNALYSGVETANEFIYNLKNSPLYDNEATEKNSLTQMMGEAKFIRAMFYHELLWYYGDIPFTMQATYETDNVLPPVTERQKVSDALIADLQEAAELMYSDQDPELASNAPERISQEAVYAMIARLALQAGGYSLNHDAGDQTNYKMTRPTNYQDYYKVAREYAKRVIDADGHKLAQSFRDVFVNECNFQTITGDDAIFEIPFAKQTSGQWGYAQGPSSSVDTGDDTNYSNSAWGATSGGVRISALYPYTFDEDDQRRDYIVGMWGYTAQGRPNVGRSFNYYNNKWSKLWNPAGFGKATTSATGINFAYIRYTDVLLMFAEAENELNGPTADAQEALKTVRRRAFTDAAKVENFSTASKEDFLKAVLDERKWEFAGENMRWKDLVRNNMYGERLVMTFLTYYAVAANESAGSPYADMVEEYEGIRYTYLKPAFIYHTYVKNIKDPNFPNNDLYMSFVHNPYHQSPNPTNMEGYGAPAAYFANTGLNYEGVSPRSITGLSGDPTSVTWLEVNNGWSNDDGTVRNEVLYSLYGYIRTDLRGNIVLVGNNGQASTFSINTANPEATLKSLPAVRYILPYPQEAIARSSGAYKNYYGY